MSSDIGRWSLEPDQPQEPSSTEDGSPDMQLSGEKMDKDRIKGAADQAKGKIKEAAGKPTGDTKTAAEGKFDQAKGKAESAAGGAKDKLRESTHHK
jgi:uncharacterized protein YjbJ (UPF0337 family)